VVTAAAIAAAIQQDHPEYADKRFGAASLRISAGGTATVDEWLERVRALYDAEALAQSRHHVVDGELAVLGLAELDDSLAQDLTAAGLLDDWRRRVDVHPRRASSDSTQWSSDSPADTDFLGRRFLAKALATRLTAMAETPDSFLIHIDGPWGSGKSTLFRFLRRELERDFLLVEVNAWREQQVGVQWWTLHSALRQAVESSAAHRWQARARSRLDVIHTRLFPFVATVVVLLAVVLGLFLLADLDLNTSSQVADSLGKIVSLVALGVAGVTAAYRFLLPESRRSAKEFVASGANPMWEVRRLFARTLARAGKPVVFLIDDLDRCDEAYVVEFLEVVQTLVRDAPDSMLEGRREGRAGGPYAFIAADGQWIRSSYESHYGGLRISDVPGRPLGYLFLEKIFQLQVRLPSITDEAKTAFYESLLAAPRPAGPPSPEEQQLVAEVAGAVRQATTGRDISRAAEDAKQITNPAQRMEVLGAAAVRFSELTIQAQTRHELAPFGRFLEPNPRSIKLFVNTYGMLQSLRTLEGVPIRTAPLALWTVVEIRWPLLADHLRAHPEDVAQERWADAPEAIASLLASPEVRAVVVESGWQPLTPDVVRECTGGTL
jgi:hypothetical protein